MNAIKVLAGNLQVAIILVCLAVFTQVAVPQSAVDRDFEPDAMNPFGRINPKAPAETKEFSFLIGEFDCQEEFLNAQTGKWIKFPAVWSAKYFLNGHGIVDQYWSPTFYTSNIRIFDENDRKWKVTFLRMSPYSTGVWAGIKEGENMVMRQGTDEKGTRLTFSNISKTRFLWTGETMTNGKASAFWRSTCKRLK